MKKKTGMWLAGFLLALLFSGRVYAAADNTAAGGEEAGVVNETESVIVIEAEPDTAAGAETNAVIEAKSGYCLGDELYVFFWMKDGYDVGSLSVKLESEEVSSDIEGTVVPVAESSSIVRYVFMVDSSGTMKHYIDQVNVFVDMLMEEEKQEAFYTVATFGEHFEVIKENLTDKNAVKEVLAGLDYTENLTDPYTGVESALAYLDSYSIRSGDIVNLIVITDGKPDLGIEDENERQEAEKERAQSAADRIANAPEVIVSTLCMEEWNENAYEVFSGSRGIHEKIDDDQDAAAAGRKMAQYVDSLYRTSFKLSEAPSVERFSVVLQIQGNNMAGQLAMLDARIEGIPNLKMFSNGTVPETAPDIKRIEEEESDSPDKQGIVEKPETEPGTEAEAEPGTETEAEPGTETEAEPETEAGTAAEAEPETEAGAEAEAGLETESGTEAGAESNSQTKLLFIIIPVICVLIIAGICIVVYIKKKNGGDSGRRERVAEPSDLAAKPALPTKPASGGIAMKLEVYAGNCATKASTLYLADVLTIGSSPECSLIFTDSEVEPLHSRIFMKNQMIYIEDMNSKEGTALGGMRIQGQNRLRSGDVISIGTVEFCLKF